MELIDNKEQLIKNINIFEGYLTEGDEYPNKEVKALVKRGTCFVAYKVDKELRFAPGRFIGYKNNKLESHLVSTEKDGRETNRAINNILGINKPLPNDELDLKYKNTAID